MCLFFLASLTTHAAYHHPAQFVDVATESLGLVFGGIWIELATVEWLDVLCYAG